MFLIAAIFIGLLIFFIGKIKTTSRYVPTWYCGEKIENEKMIIPGTHFYKTVSNMKGFRQLYDCQAKGWFDLYNLAGKTGLTLTAFLRWMHSGLLPVYLTWVTLGLLLILFVVCSIW
jgi:hypothetical protein